MICQLASVGAFAETAETVEDKGTVSAEVAAKETEAEKQEETEPLSSVQSVSEEFKSKPLEEYEEIVSELSVEMDPLSDSLVLNFSAEEQYALERVLDSYKEANGSDTDEVLVSESPYSYNSTYYYSQLKTDDEKKFYMDMKKAMDNIQYSTEDLSGTMTNYGMLIVDYVPVSSTISTARANAIFKAFYYENPQYFFNYGSYSYSYKDENETLSSYAVGIAKDYAAYSERARLQSVIDDYAMPIIQAAEQYTKDVDKESYIAEMLCNSISYNSAAVANGTSGGTNQNIVGAFVNKTCVCNGFAMASTYLLNAVGINAIGMTSDAAVNSNGENVGAHAWNNVYVDGTWYVLDTTWMNTDRFLSSEKEDINYSRFNKSYSTFHNESEYSKICHTNSPIWGKNYSMPACTRDYLKAPDVPTGLKAVSGINSVQLSWNGSSDGEWYELYYTYGGTYKFMKYVYSNEITISDLDSSQNWVSFCLRACSRGGKSEYSKGASADIYGSDDIISPQGLTAYAGFGSVFMEWNKNDDVDGFKVYWRNDEGNDILWADTKDNYIRFQDLDCERTYPFYVRSYKGSEFSNWKAYVTVKPLSENTVTVSDVDNMLIFDCIDWVNSFEKSLDNNNVLTAPQLHAIERVLDMDYNS